MTPPPSSPAWARVRILLNLGDIPAAASAATQALPGMSKRYRSHFGGTQVFANPDIPSGWCYLNPVRRSAVVNLDVWDAHACHPAMYSFCDDVIPLLGAPVFARYDVESWQLLDELTRIKAGNL